jgi:hypothetical protein
MNDEEQDEEREQPENPAKLLPYSKRLVPEDPEVVVLPKAHIPSHPALFSENYS